MKRGLLLIALLAPGLAPADQALEKRLERIERRVAMISELLLKVDGLEQANRRLLGRVEALEYQLKRLERKQRELYLDLDERLGKLSRTPVVPPVPAAEAPAAVPTQGPASAPPKAPTKEQATAETATAAPKARLDASPAEIQAEYDAAYALLQPSQRRYGEAIEAFKAFLEKYPHSELADNALYWLGETYYVTEQNDQALATFEALLERYPQSDKVPGALLKKGYLLDLMGRKEEARKVLQSLVDRYPDAAVARVAKVRLNRL